MRLRTTWDWRLPETEGYIREELHDFEDCMRQELHETVDCRRLRTTWHWGLHHEDRSRVGGLHETKDYTRLGTTQDRGQHEKRKPRGEPLYILFKSRYFIAKEYVALKITNHPKYGHDEHALVISGILLQGWQNELMLDMYTEIHSWSTQIWDGPQWRFTIFYSSSRYCENTGYLFHVYYRDKWIKTACSVKPVFILEWQERKTVPI